MKLCLQFSSLNTLSYLTNSPGVVTKHKLVNNNRQSAISNAACHSFRMSIDFGKYLWISSQAESAVYRIILVGKILKLYQVAIEWLLLLEYLS